IYFSEQTPDLAIAQVSVTGGETVLMPTQLRYPNLIDIAPERSELLVAEATTFGTDWPLWTLPVLGGTPRRIAQLLAHDGGWSPNGQEIAYAAGSSLYVAMSDGTDSRRLATVGGIIWWPRWSPDGNVFALHSNERQNQRSFIVGNVGGRYQSASLSSRLEQSAGRMLRDMDARWEVLPLSVQAQQPNRRLGTSREGKLLAKRSTRAGASD